jgi:hypothetical protein
LAFRIRAAETPGCWVASDPLRLPEIITVEPNLTLEGLRLAWNAAHAHGHLQAGVAKMSCAASA